MEQKHQPWAPAVMAMDIEKQASSHPREATELDAIASAVGEEGRRSSLAAYVLCVAGLGLGLVCVSTIAFFSVWLLITAEDPNYTLAVAAVSGLDMGGRPTLDPEFKLTVGIVSRDVLGPPRCNVSTTTLKVAYHGYELASAAAPQLCGLGGDGMKKTSIVVRERLGTTAVHHVHHDAQGGLSRLRARFRGGAPALWSRPRRDEDDKHHGAGYPRVASSPVLDGLAVDLRRAAGVFDVTLTIRVQYPTARHGYGLLVSCMGRRVGDDAGALCGLGDLDLERGH
ncbi:hypothetical protein D1007_33532 [Hordeum vulgare]|nr:hypothetical protein D1007_33532 [Hordeum vulgare]